jgi:hypothetical protein
MITKAATLIRCLDSRGLLSAASKVYDLISIASLEEYKDRVEESAKRNEMPFSHWFNGESRVYLDLYSEAERGQSETIEDTLRQEFSIILDWAVQYYKEDPSKSSLLNGRLGSGRKIGEKFFRNILSKRLMLVADKYSGDLNINTKQFSSLFSTLFMLPEDLLSNTSIDILNEVPENLASRFTVQSQIFAGTDIEKLTLSREVVNIIKDVTFWMKEYQTSSLRSNKSLASPKVVISQLPKDIATMSTGRDWSSCVDLEDGIHKEDIFCELSKGGFVAYLIRPEDLDVKSPIARLWIRRFESPSGASIAIPEETVYGNDKSGFYEAVEDWINSKQGDIEYGPYRLQGADWSDSFEKSHVIIPDDPALLEDMFINPEKYIGTLSEMYSVTDNLYYNYANLFEGGDPYSSLRSESGDTGVLGGHEFIEKEKVFNTKEEAQTYIDNIGGWKYVLGEYIDINPEFQNLDEHGDLDEDAPLTDEAEEILKYVTGDTTRFEITEVSPEDVALPYVKQLRNKVYSDAKRNPDIVSDKLAMAIYNEYHGDFRHKYNSKSRDTVLGFPHLFPKDMVNAAIKASGYPMVEYAKLYKGTKDGLKKEELRSNLIDMAGVGLSPKVLIDASINDRSTLSDPRSILHELSKDGGIPNRIIVTILDSFQNIEGNPDVKSTDQATILKELLYTLAAAKADTPDVVRLYSEIIPRIRMTGFSRGIARDMIYGDDALFKAKPHISEIGSALSNTGRAGAPLIPLLESKYAEVDGIKEDDLSSTTRSGRTADQYKNALKESILYIADSIRTGRLSTKYERHFW